jgi:hypothetical protein
VEKGLCIVEGYASKFHLHVIQCIADRILCFASKWSADTSSLSLYCRGAANIICPLPPLPRPNGRRPGGQAGEALLFCHSERSEESQSAYGEIQWGGIGF